MNTAWTILTLLLLTLATGCGKKCQPPAEEPFQTFVDQKWRVVETTDPQMKKLGTTTFVTMTFTKEYSVAVNLVENNREFQVPVLIGEYNVDPNRKLINVVYEVPPKIDEQGAAAEETETASQSQKFPTIQYTYDLGREFQLKDGKSGYFYRMVPFMGVVYPDNQCTF